MNSNVAKLILGVKHLNHASIKIEGRPILYFDPYQILTEPHDADVIFITHTHGDHLSPADIGKVMKRDTTFIVPQDGVEQLKNLGATEIITVAPEKKYSITGIDFQTIPAYNLNKKFHPKQNGWVGYNMTLNNHHYYIAGDTDFIPEMNQIQTAVAFLPVGGTYTMTADEAVKAADVIKPAIAIPIHYGSVVGSLADAQKFISLLNPEITGVML